MGFFGKGSEERVTETLTFIRITPVTGISQTTRNKVANFCGNLYPNTTATERAALANLAAGMSVKGHIQPGVAPGTEAERHMRRAIYLMWTSLGKKQALSHAATPKAEAAVRTMLPAQLQQAYEDVLLRCAVVAWPGGAVEVFDLLASHPVRFLRRHMIGISGATTGIAKFNTPWAAGQDDTNVIANCTFQYNLGSNDRFMLVVNQPPAANLGAGHSFAAVSVPAVLWSAVPGVGAHPGNFAGMVGTRFAAPGGTTMPTVMLTTQFTGCAFVWHRDGANTLRAAHIGPGTYAGTGTALANQIIATGAFTNAAGGGAITVFGSGAGNAAIPVPTGGAPLGGLAGNYPVAATIANTHILGFDKGGAGWRFYTQSVNMAQQIIAARRIY